MPTSGIDTRTALQMPGVHAVLTGKDYDADGLGSLPSMAPYKSRGGGPMYLPPRPAIAFNRVMHVGYPVAVVVADTLDQARDAAERVDIDYAPRPSVVSAPRPSTGRAAALRRMPEQRSLFLPGRRQGQDGCRLRRLRRTSSSSASIINRVTANPIEPRGVTGEYDAGTGRYTLHCGFQRPWLFRNDIAEHHAQDPGGGVRLITGDIGGSYGLRGSVYPEIILMLWAADASADQ